MQGTHCLRNAGLQEVVWGAVRGAGRGRNQTMAFRGRIETRVGGKDVRRRHGVDLQRVDGAKLALSRRAPRREWIYARLC